MTRSTSLAILLVVFLAPALDAGEGYTDYQTGATIRLAGYGLDSNEVRRSPVLDIEINRTYATGDPRAVTLEVGDARVAGLRDAVVFACGLWENLPSCRLDLGIGMYRTWFGDRENDGLNHASLGKEDYGYGGESFCYLATAEDGLREIVDFDSLLNQTTARTNPTWARLIMAQELGHGMGFNHSWLTRPAVARITMAPSRPSVMAYGTGGEDAVRAGALNPDDAGVACRLYPDSFQRASRTTGTIRARALSADGARELYGANVLLVDRATGAAVASRISGYETSHPTGERNGFVELDAVPPGTYDLLVAALTDTRIDREDPGICYLSADSTGFRRIMDAIPGFDRGFGLAWVREIPVSAGEVVDVGWAQAGTDRSFLRPGWVEVVERWSGSERSSTYLFDLWSDERSEMDRRVEVPSATCAVRLRPGRYAVRIHGWNGANWVLLQDWTWRSFHARRVTMTWDRLETELKPGQFAEALQYEVSIRREGTSLPAVRPLHGVRYTRHLASSSSVYDVQARFAANEPAFPILFERPVTTIAPAKLAP